MNLFRCTLVSATDPRSVTVKEPSCIVFLSHDFIDSIYGVLLLKQLFDRLFLIINAVVFVSMHFVCIL